MSIFWFRKKMGFKTPGLRRGRSFPHVFGALLREYFSAVFGGFCPAHLGDIRHRDIPAASFRNHVFVMFRKAVFFARGAQLADLTVISRAECMFDFQTALAAGLGTRYRTRNFLYCQTSYSDRMPQILKNQIGAAPRSVIRPWRCLQKINFFLTIINEKIKSGPKRSGSGSNNL